MGQIRLSGIVTAVSERTKVSGNANSISQTSTMHFRIDGRPVSLNAPMSISDGDRVTAICADKAEPVVIALVNHTTNVVFGPNWKFSLALAVAMIAASLPLMTQSLGWFFLQSTELNPHPL
jgi:hypothetical protein